MIRFFWLAIVLGALLCSTSFVQSQTSGQESTSSESPTEDKKETGKTEAKKPASKPKPPRKVFNPTEEISEDSPVPFPVDI